MKARAKVREAGLRLTASGKEQALVNFYDQLDRDGWTASELARVAGVGRAYLTRVFNGHETGERTWVKILPLLSERALFCVKQCSAWNTHAEAALQWVRRIRAVHARITEVTGNFGTVYVLDRAPLLFP